MKLVYLACPYSHKLAEVQATRVRYASHTAAVLMSEGFAVYSPITHGHHVHPFLQKESNHAFWMKQCLPILRMCDALMVLPLPGWRESRGVQQEITAAKSVMIPCEVIQNLPGFPVNELEYLPLSQCESLHLTPYHLD